MSLRQPVYRSHARNGRPRSRVRGGVPPESGRRGSDPVESDRLVASGRLGICDRCAAVLRVGGSLGDMNRSGLPPNCPTAATARTFDGRDPRPAARLDLQCDVEADLSASLPVLRQPPRRGPRRRVDRGLARRERVRALAERSRRSGAQSAVLRSGSMRHGDAVQLRTVARYRSGRASAARDYLAPKGATIEARPAR